MRRLEMCCAVLVVFSVVGCKSESSTPRQSTASTSPATSALLVLPDATDVKTANRYDGEVTYTLQEMWPAEKTIAFIGQQLAAGGWRPSETYLLSPDKALREWEQVIVGRETVFSWSAQWSNSAGDVVFYSLNYRVTGTTGNESAAGPLHVSAVFVSRATADALQKGIKDSVEKDSKLRP